MDFQFKVGIDLVTGRWDRIDETPEGIVLVDYKTGDVDDADKAVDRAKASLKAEQLGLYVLAYRETRQVRPARAQLHFVGSGVVGDVEVTDEHFELALQRVRAAAAGIRAGEFPAAPDQRKCGDCPYSRFCQHSVART